MPGAEQMGGDEAWRHGLAVLLLLAVLASAMGCASLGGTEDDDLSRETTWDLVVGYLPPGGLPDSLVIVPLPPGPGSPTFVLDEEVSRRSLALRGTKRWNLAARDAVLDFPEAARTFSCALGVEVTEDETPHLYMLLRRTMIDALFSTFPAKDRYVRPRPFVVNGAPICSPEYESELRQSGSYPSGHTAIGWAWALILGEIMPERGDAIIKRGRAYGENRIICNVHWYSDVVEGRIVGAAAVSRLRADPAFQADLEKARQEIAALRGKKPSPAVDCHEEAAAMAQPYALP